MKPAVPNRSAVIITIITIRLIITIYSYRRLAVAYLYATRYGPKVGCGKSACPASCAAMLRYAQNYVDQSIHHYEVKFRLQQIK